MNSLRAFLVYLLCFAAAASAWHQPLFGQSRLTCNILWDQYQAASGSARTAALQRFRGRCRGDRRGLVNQPPPPPPAGPDSRRTGSPAVATSSRPRQIVLDAAGGGQARTFSDALARVATNGTILIRPGRYEEHVEITRSVTLIGDPAAAMSRPLIVGAVVVRSGRVAIRDVNIQSVAYSSPFYVSGGVVDLRNSRIWFEAELPPAGWSGTDQFAVSITGGRVGITDALLGPGYAGVIAITGGHIEVTNTEIRSNRSEAIFAMGTSRVEVHNSRLRGRRILYVMDRADIGFLWNQVESSDIDFPIILRGTPTVSILSNTFTGRSDLNWLAFEASVTRRLLTGNVDGAGHPLTAPRAGLPAR
jgi:hypothetical protein